MIDFQARIKDSLRSAIKYTANLAMWYLSQDYTWSYDVNLEGDTVSVMAWNKSTLLKDIDKETPHYVFSFAGRTIDAALLEQLHNEVTAWFTAIKSEASI